MGMPQIPEGVFRPTTDELLIDLLESIALDQMSLSHIMNAQGELIQEMLSKWTCDDISFHEVQCSIKSTGSILEDIIMKEWLMQKRLHTIEEIGCSLKPTPKPSNNACNGMNAQNRCKSCYDSPCGRNPRCTP